MFDSWLKSLAEELVGEDKVSEFALWSFGEDYLILSCMEDFVHSWNKLHSDLYRINMSSSIYDDMLKMTDLWKEHGQR